MKKPTVVIVAILLASAFLVSQGVSLTVAGGCGGGGCGGGGGGSTGSPLSDYEKQALNIAIDEEYLAKATYMKVMATFGSIKPFPCIANCEQKHINAVANLLIKYGLPIPQDPWTGHIAIDFTSRQQACEIGAQAEIDNAAVYDEMIPQIGHSDIVSTFSMLRDVSRYRHLPAFRYWAEIYASQNQ